LLTDDFYHNFHFLSHQSAKKGLKIKKKKHFQKNEINEFFASVAATS